MNIDHIFIFTDDNGSIADELADLGLTEGGSRNHEGQGTANRTFVFENFYLEILWVRDEQEIKSNKILPTGLHTRAGLGTTPASPFGLCIENTDETEALFKNAFPYQPDYFPQGKTIDILNREHNLYLPWTFRLPFKRNRQGLPAPVSHNTGMSVLTEAVFYYPAADDQGFLDHFTGQKAIRFQKADNTGLTLTFDKGRQGLTNKLDALQLTILY
ncbi:hypothetical protein A8C56_13245 [Niabella ginsenosidivorans]|uniref:Glyoxalase-like domain-containing protein n=1 Tax=Niabella ginsenosidivorans TaxID=1176587 RepID=A0A1A9I2G7_9BACT|nr:VOC family protein [Niabella ginsenosidivorans]ANH81816.1 hypothetical protein A8C56_13245 [Niabella ginsenosidivorans]